MTASALDGVPGLGETRRKALLKQFGSLKRLSAASVEEVMVVPGVGRRTAEAVVTALATRGERPMAINTATGEILDPDGDEPAPTPDGPGHDDGEDT
jgi:excinuclease ABC subunit C